MVLLPRGKLLQHMGEELLLMSGLPSANGNMFDMIACLYT